MLCLSDLEFNLKSVRVIGKGNQERRVLLPEAFGQVFGFWLKDRARGEYMFARAVGQKPVSAQAARVYLRGMLKKAGIDKKISPRKLRHTYATNRLDAGADLVDIKALLGHATINIRSTSADGSAVRVHAGAVPAGSSTAARAAGASLAQTRISAFAAAETQVAAATSASSTIADPARFPCGLICIAAA